MAFPSFFLHIRIDNPCARPRLRSLLSLVQSLRSFSLFFLLLQCLCLRKLDKLVAVWILTSLSVARLSINFESFPSFLMNRSRFWRLFFYSWIRLTDSCWITDGRIFYSRLRYPSLYLNPHFLVNFYFPFLSCWSSTGFDGDLHGLAVLEGEQNKNGNFSKLFEDSGGTVRAQFRCVRSLANLTSWLLILLFFFNGQSFWFVGVNWRVPFFRQQLVCTDAFRGAPLWGTCSSPDRCDCNFEAALSKFEVTSTLA